MLNPRDQVEFCQSRYAFVNDAAAAQAGKLNDEGRWDNFVVSATEFDLFMRHFVSRLARDQDIVEQSGCTHPRKYAKILIGEVSHGLWVELHLDEDIRVFEAL